MRTLHKVLTWLLHMYCVFSGSITFYQYTLESSALTNTLIPRCFTVSNTLSSSLHCIKTTPPKKCYLILTQPHCYTIKLLFLCTNRARFGTHNRFKPPAICKPCTYVNIFVFFTCFWRSVFFVNVLSIAGIASLWFGFGFLVIKMVICWMWWYVCVCVWMMELSPTIPLA